MWQSRIKCALCADKGLRTCRIGKATVVVMSFGNRMGSEATFKLPICYLGALKVYWAIVRLYAACIGATSGEVNSAYQ